MQRMEITTKIGCTLMCTFCPQQKLKKTYKNISDNKLMSFEDYKKYLNKIPKYVQIDFSGMSEPWLNKDTTKMLQYTLEKNHKVSVYTTLYGMSIDDANKTIKLLNKFKNLVTEVVLHMPDASGNMPGFKISDEYIEILKVFISFKNKKVVKRFKIMTMDESGKYHEEIAKILGSTKKFFGHSRAGNIDGIESPKHNCPVTCASSPYYDHNELLPNGDVLLCCMDYGLKHVIGNINDLDYYQLFNNDVINKLRVENQNPAFTEKSLCKSCNNVIEHGKQKTKIPLNTLVKSKLSRLFK